MTRPGKAPATKAGASHPVPLDGGSPFSKDENALRHTPIPIAPMAKTKTTAGTPTLIEAKKIAIASRSLGQKKISRPDTTLTIDHAAMPIPKVSAKLSLSSLDGSSTICRRSPGSGWNRR